MRGKNAGVYPYKYEGGGEDESREIDYPDQVRIKCQRAQNVAISLGKRVKIPILCLRSCVSRW
jgi:hypothetical protein